MAENPLKKVGRFITDEMLGIDDFGRVFTKASQGDVSGAIKSAGAGVLELGSTVFTGGVGTVAKQGAKAGVKAGVKAAATQGAKTTGVKTTAAKVVPDAVRTAPGPSDLSYLMGTQFRGASAATKTKPGVKPVTKPGDLPGAPGYPRTPAKPGDLPGAPGYPAVKPEPIKPKPQPQPQTQPKPKPAPEKKPVKKAAVTTKTKKTTSTKDKTSPKGSTSAKSPKATNIKNVIRTGVAAKLATDLFPPGKTSDGTWNPSAIV